MKQNIRPDIDHTKCNAYSSVAHMYTAISVEKSPVFTTYIEGAKNRGIPDDKKGGIIVFTQGVYATFSDMQRILQRHDPMNYTIGNFFKGRYTAKDGEVYSEDSLSIEITGISDNVLVEIGEECCRAFNQEAVLIKAYSERNLILIVNGE